MESKFGGGRGGVYATVNFFRLLSTELGAVLHFALIPNNILAIMARLREYCLQAEAKAVSSQAAVKQAADQERDARPAPAAITTRRETKHYFDWRTRSEYFQNQES
ncbi:hypothetical protein [Massilia niastensis]|uniref:hypothetical protein n=1 Tax=Massilia niastensis TaxID=544911 RepID=UPI0012EBF93C|nr:hypothetical protein [Massilia niastensis]